MLVNELGFGFFKTVIGTDQAAGVEITETVPTGKTWILHAMYFTLVTSATVATRNVTLVIDDGTNIFMRLPGTLAQTASQTLNYPASKIGSQFTVANLLSPILLPCDNVVLPAGYRIRTITNNIQAGDNFGAPTLFVEERA